MKDEIINNNTKHCNNTPEKMKITKKSEDYCIINNQKIEGNACNTIVNNK
ncbi:hypothetical protein HMPREF1982_03506 [Clostridiales bacterium oral taxon 876 str. F0540]|nr:hypothetical protein HMPREF1982_03506 [Clostridiales bacterium oral taxon 876 str. F0540]